MLPQNNNERIDAYLSGDSSPEDQSDFERKIAEDPDLAAEVRLWRKVDEAISDKQTLEFQRVVVATGKEYLAQTGGSPARVRWLLSIAAAFLVLVTGGFLTWQLNQEAPLNGPQLYAANLKPYKLTSPTVRGGEATVQTGLDRATSLYQEGNFAAAAAILAPLQATYQDSVELVFPLANAYLNQQPPQTELAEAQFQRVIDQGDNAHVHEARWYLALINLQRENFTKAKALLEAAGRVEDATGRRARALRDQLD